MLPRGLDRRLPSPPLRAAAAPACHAQIDLQPVLTVAGPKLEAVASPSGAKWVTQTDPSSGQWVVDSAFRWTSGFLAGCLWRMRALTGAESWAQLARAQLPALAPMQHNKDTHDVGFIMMSSYGLALEAGLPDAPTRDWQRAVVNGAASLASRRVLRQARQYNPTVGCIRAWNNPTAQAGAYKVIIDGMMNLGLLFAGVQLPGGKPDTSSGQPQAKYNWQGYSDASTWSRGQAWAIYGFAQAYAATNRTNPLFLATAKKAADLFLKRLPADGVPPWDFDAPASKPWKDTSAAAVAAAGLLRLAAAAADASAVGYQAAALRVLNALVAGYLSPGGKASAAAPASILTGGTGNVAQGSYNTGLIYGDYYFLEALQLLQSPAQQAPTGGKATAAASSGSAASAAQAAPEPAPAAPRPRGRPPSAAPGPAPAPRPVPVARATPWPSPVAVLTVGAAPVLPGAAVAAAAPAAVSAMTTSDAPAPVRGSAAVWWALAAAAAAALAALRH
eukprot:scaffold12.g8013.t1